MLAIVAETASQVDSQPSDRALGFSSVYEPTTATFRWLEPNRRPSFELRLTAESNPESNRA